MALIVGFSNNGIDGIDGINGEQGEKGDTGAKGEKGDTGAAGTNGVDGAAGLTTGSFEVSQKNIDSNYDSVDNTAGVFKPTYIFKDSAGDTSLEIRAMIANNEAVLFGKDAGAGSLYATQSVYLGCNAAKSIMGGGQNVAIGYGTLNGVGGFIDHCVAIGANALAANTTSENLAIGYMALSSNVGGPNNTAVGGQALQSCVNGMNNTSVGFVSSMSLVSGNCNAAVGSGAFNGTGNNNVAFGYMALNGLAAGSGNIGIGANAGNNYSGSTSGHNNATDAILIGRDTKTLAAGGINEIVIGAGGVGKGSNTLLLGNASTTDNYIYGNLELLGTSKGIIIASPDGTRYKITVANGGAISATAV